MNRNIFTVSSLATTLMLFLACAMCSCRGGSALEEAAKAALLNGDTTQTRYTELCQIVKADERAYAAYLTDDGEVNAAAMNEMINRIGQSLRPPRSWNVTAYAQKPLTLSIYLERSGSMTPYDTHDGGGELKMTVNRLINFFPRQTDDEAKIYIVNDGVYDYTQTTDNFLKDKNIYASTAQLGDARYTDFSQIFNTILSRQADNEVSVLVSDLIYSPRDASNVSVAKLLNEVSSLATGVFKHYSNKSVLLYKVAGSYHGLYYPYCGGSFRYDGPRPFYVMIIANSDVIDRLTGDPTFSQFVNISGAEHQYRFNQAASNVNVTLLPSWPSNRGRYRVARDAANALEHCEAERATGVLQFSIAANLDVLGKTDEFLTDAANVSINSASQFTAQVTRITSEMRSGNMRSYLEGMTHIITFAAKPENLAADHITLKIRNTFPSWIEQSSTNDDTNSSAPAFESTTFGLQSFMQGIYDAFARADNSYATINIDVSR
ncbi:MAG: hypothetical protein ACI308_10535 [Muribaculaceae bacterium]